MKRSALTTAVKMALTGAVAGSLVACGGGGSGSSDSGSAASTGTSVGPVSGFGSVYVNGTRFETNGSVSSDDGIEREGQLEKGMILKVRGSWGDDGQGRADRLDYDDSVRGRLQSATWNEVEGTGTLQVAGQDILVDGQTVFKGATPETLAAASANTYKVRISAWRLQDGSFRASFVGAKLIGSGFDDFDDFNEVEIEGAIAGLDTQSQTFEINGITVDYQSAEFDDDLERDDLTNGLIVEVEGYIDGNGVLIAEEIDDEDDLFGDDDDVEIAGAISGDYDSSARQFQLNGITVQVTGSTEFDDGLGEDDLSDGLLVKVEGNFRSGVLVAEEIEPRDGDAELDGRIESRNGSDLVVSGVRVMLTSNTLIENDDDDDDDDNIVLRTQDIESLMVGDFVEIEGLQRLADGGYLEAITIEREDGDDDDYQMEGRVTAINDNSITVLGLTLGRGDADFSGIQVGQEVEIDYLRNIGGDYIVVDIEDDD
ncbi:DUF5666 domain-containing protein [Marinobacter confluentis]|uniref:DUF5666 domain-containing protein n=1 Tax=Marinobacter confluentis TaxID=1697557 RepID=A0A4Z1C056_9GAMM|nr:DUF5666 domain-containing protein [Marinobacter confluentis]TGN40358.1 hypothetical protein E5Q11_08815 [Marinobacter confluentis]